MICLRKIQWAGQNNRKQTTVSILHELKVSEKPLLAQSDPLYLVDVASGTMYCDI